MIPEGLQYSSIHDVISKIKSLGMNSVRMGYATEMVDDILDNGGDVTLRDALDRTLGENATAILSQIIEHNPTFTANTTRLQVWDAVAAELHAQQLHLIFNNHVSKAKWCCNLTDGNGWFGDTYFDVVKWKRGLNYMADYAKRWPAATALSLRNELREVANNPEVSATYGWSLWYDEMTTAAAGMHAANPDALILFSGLGYDHELNEITAGQPLSDTDNRTFKLSDFEYADKIVFELHSYDNGATNCADLQSQFYDRGFNALDTSPLSTARNVAPVLLTEFGFAQNGTDYESVYAQCIKNFVTGSDRRADAARIEGGIGWLEWGISGSYYIREGIQDFDDWWAIFNHDWSGFRNETVLTAYQKPMIKETLA
ncbi:cellulase family protein [Bisporella sp. PMI_857]|nr:cellulase family protein [Bisporella sp. PMI_857]